MDAQVTLTVDRLKDAGSICPGRRFTFIVGQNRKEYSCSIFQACFISQKVCRQLAIDSTIESLRVLPEETNVEFRLMEKLWNGESIRVNSYNVETLFKLAKALENNELHANLMKVARPTAEISLENCVSQLHLKSTIGMDTNSEIAFMARNFYKLTRNDLQDLTVGELEAIISHSELKIASENGLFDLIDDFSQSNPEYLLLLKYIEPKNLDDRHLTLLLDKMSFDIMDSMLWEKMSQLLRVHSKHISTGSSFASSSRCAYESSKYSYHVKYPMYGIVANLTRKCGGNPHKCQSIEITASSNASDCSHVVDYDTENCWKSSDFENSYIQFDFKDNQICMDGYSMRFGLSRDPRYNWVVLGSNDGSVWTTLDEQRSMSKSSQLKSDYAIHHVDLDRPSMNYFRYIRIKRIVDSYIMMHVNGIEFFGILRQREGN